MSEQDEDFAAPEPPENAFLSALGEAERPALPFRVAVVVAHPDDEVIGCGAQLSRFADPTIIHVTDGAPADGVDARRLGFPGPIEYAAARRGELEAAMALAGLGADRLVALGCPDQGATANIASLAADLARHLAGLDVVVTHAYEGGHPDHDSTALAVHAACALLRRDGGTPDIVEMPLYRAGPEGMATQSFAPIEESREYVIPLDWEQQQLKHAMYAAHASQHDVLLLFSADAERFRLAPRYDFAMRPNGGEVYYERQPWGMDGARWQERARAALAELGLGSAPGNPVA